jgi:hypothetical protein
MTPVNVSTPVMIKRVSPGSKNPTRRPVSAKTMKQIPSKAYAPKPSMRFCGSSHGIRAVATTAFSKSSVVVDDDAGVAQGYPVRG